jgi:hypothetical protein
MKLIGAFAASLVIPSLRQQQQRRFLMSTIAMKKPFAVIVQAEIQPDRMNEFLAMIELNAKESRKEPGCMRFGTFLYTGFLYFFKDYGDYW